MYTNISSAISVLSDADLLGRLRLCASRERQATAVLVAHLAEVDARRLHAAEGCSSLFTYCTQVLHFSEHAAYLRIEAARAARRFPKILDLLAQGAVHLTAIGLLAPHLTAENHRPLLEEVKHKSKRQIEVVVARLRPQPPVPSAIRKLPQSPPRAAMDLESGLVSGGSPKTEGGHRPEPCSATGLPAAGRPAHPAVVAPLSPERLKIQFTASAETCEKLRRAQDLLRHQVPDGDPAEIFDRALTALLERLSKGKLAATDHPREGRRPAEGSRHIPAEVKRQVWLRDGGRCAFVATSGRRCAETSMIEFHHLKPYALGGEATVDGTALRCRAHNVHEAELVFGPRTLLARERLARYAGSG